jgi:hypothetical protein
LWWRHEQYNHNDKRRHGTDAEFVFEFVHVDDRDVDDHHDDGDHDHPGRRVRALRGSGR